MLEQADAAVRQGAGDRARIRLREAANAYPTAKQPWARLADDYFAAADFGNAIVAAQEVLQRDPQDRRAQDMLAVGGLQVSLEAIRSIKGSAGPSGWSGESKTQALDLSKALRESLGDTVAAPRRPADAPPVAQAVPAVSATSVGSTTTNTSATAAKTSKDTKPKAPTPATAPNQPPRDPLDRLR